MLYSRSCRILCAGVTGVLLGIVNLNSGQAEVVLHGATPAPLPGPAITVSGDVGRTEIGAGGNNLFHSFSVFNILSSESVTFTSPLDGVGNPISIANVISRVTGGTSAITGQKFSVIDGTLNSIPGANFWFINPNGVIFGSNARLNVGGSFHASTADYIKLDGGNIFAATPSMNEVLTSAPPSAFGFLSANPAAIQMGTQSFNILAVPVGETLSLVAGTIDIGAPTGTAPGFVLAPAGRVNLVGVGPNLTSTVEASFDPAKISGPLTDGVPTDRDITARYTNDNSLAPLGTINIVGGNLGGTVFGSVVDGKEIFIRSGNLVVNHGLVNPGFFAERNAPFPPADGGQIRVVSSGDVTITGSTPVFGLDSGIHARSGLAASITSPRDTPNIIVEAGGKVTVGTPGAGRAAIRSDRFTGNTTNPASFGNVTISADTLEVAGGGQIAASNFFSDGGPGRGGNLTVNARELMLSGEGAARFTGLTTQSDFHLAYPEQFTNPLLTTAGGGKLTVNADTLTMEKGANITADSFAFGPSGDIEITVGDMFLSRDGVPTGSIAAQSTLAGKAGNITIKATGRIAIDEARISATTGGSGDGGSVNVAAGGSISVSGKDAGVISLTAPPVTAALDQFAQVLNPFFQANFGVTTPNFVALVTAIEGQGVDLPEGAGWFEVLDALNRPPFSVTAVADITPGNGGQISVTTPRLILNADTRIDSSTATDGNAGAILGNVGSLSLNGGAAIRSQSGVVLLDTGQLGVGTGNAGSVTFNVSDTISISGRSPTSGSGSSISTTTFATGKALNKGKGGDIFLSAGSNVDILNGGSISADSLSADPDAGDTGSVTINAGNQIVMTNGSVSTRAVTSDGGNIALNAPNIINLTNSQITTSVESGVGSGGNISIDPEFLILNNSQVLANAFGGPGGNINIVAGNFLPSATSLVQASSALSTQGTIVVASPENNVAASIAQLPQNIVDVSGLLPERCAARRAGTPSSSFTVAGRGGVPIDPDGYLPSSTGGTGSPKGSADVSPTASQAALQSAKHILLAMAGAGCTR